MAIIGGNGQFPIDLAAVGVDTVLLDQNDRLVVTQCSIHNTSDVAEKEVWFYVSADVTSANGKRVASYTLAPSESMSIVELIGQGVITTNTVLAVQKSTGALAGDVNVLITQTTYTEGS